MSETDVRHKQSLYFDLGTIEEIEGEARRLDRSRSWIIQKAWRIARAKIKAMSSDPEKDSQGGEPSV